MLIIGCDYHPSMQQIAWVDKETGECGERRLLHRSVAEEFYRQIKGKQVRGATSDGCPYRDRQLTVRMTVAEDAPIAFPLSSGSTQDGRAGSCSNIHR